MSSSFGYAFTPLVTANLVGAGAMQAPQKSSPQGVRYAQASVAPNAFKIIASPEAKAQHTLDSTRGSTAYNWSDGNGPTLLPRSSTHICLLTKISGRFEGYGEQANNFLRPNADGQLLWKLEAKNQATGGIVDVAARCYARDQ